MIAWFARNHVAANLLMITLLALGMLSLTQRIPLEVFPTLDPQRINVAVSLRGATPQETEEGVAIRVEEAIQDLEGIEQITSRSSEGSASINIEVEPGHDPRELLADVKSRVDAINTFPVNAEKPVISLAIRRAEVISIAVASIYGEREVKYQAEQIRDDLLRLPGVTQVELDSVRPYEIAIEVSESTLRNYDLTLVDISQAVANSSLDVSAGNIKTEGGDILIRASGQAYRRDDFDNIVVLTQPDGSLIRLKDIAQVYDGFEESSFRSRFNGKLAAFVDVYRVGDQSALGVAKKVKDYIAERQATMPEGFELSLWRDRSLIVEKRLQTLTQNAIQGGILVLILLTLFLRPTIAFWVFIGIPVSFMGAFIAMPFFGVTLNIFSLFAFLLVLGIVVDDAIVTGENIYTHLRRSESGLEAAIQGTREVAVPVTFGILTTIAAFLPIAFLEGRRGLLFAQIPVVVIPIFLFSLIESKLVLPAHLKSIKLRPDRQPGRLERWQQSFADGFEKMILRFYQPVLRWSLHNRYLTLVMFVGILMVIIALISNGWLRFTFFPRVQSEIATASLTMPTGTAFNITDAYVQRITDAAYRLKAQHRDPDTGLDIILDIQSSTGSNSSGGAHTGRVRLEVVAPEDRTSTITSSQLTRQWRDLIGVLPGVETLTFRAEIGRVSDPIDIQFSGNDLDTLSAIADKVKARLQLYPYVFDIADSLSDGKEELQLELTDEAYALGLSRADIINQVRQAFFGAEVQRIQRGRDDIRVMVRYPEAERSAIANLKDLRIKTADGRRVPLEQVALLKPGKSPAAIYRIDRYRTVNVTADVNKQQANMVVLQRDLQTYIDQLLAQNPDVKYSFEGEAKEQRESFGSLGLGIVFVLFIIYCLLAIPFKSYLQPLIVMSVIPFGIIGAVAGHLIMGKDLTLLSLLGMMALVGVVVNDSLVLVDFINKNKQGLSLQKAILNAGAARFRPVMLTSITTFIGLMPLLFEKSTQAQFLIPMAVSLGFGILFATFITLILVPVNYLVTAQLQSAVSDYLRQLRNPEPLAR
ncbi:efflux RND transporter permease subunit [Exilibacterium tricleocarpae]|uniref:Efflux RND transporter permease subunit n=1 Tax=Exilibacterium tricleocarpae TaxID=2591008 RepID=A0A545SXI2_9GAMM|nr:efflux RND transporter permease subunit [Exilibacterium tricleocarpae]TQV69672.1 efflux RND transporter permease subunit [Exilibacterium tricleocarpae]